MLLDISHTIHHFLEELPDNLADFKELVQTTFPNLVDTKHMSSAGPFRELISSHVLFDLAKRIEQPPFKLPSEFEHITHILLSTHCHKCEFFQRLGSILVQTLLDMN